MCVSFIWYYKVDTTHDRDGLTFTRTFTLCRAPYERNLTSYMDRGRQPLTFSQALRNIKRKSQMHQKHTQNRQINIKISYIYTYSI